MAMILVITMGLTILQAAQNNQPKNKNLTFRLGILYINSPAGERFRDGILEAVDNYNAPTINFETINYPYDNEAQGLKKLVSLLEDKKDGQGQREVDIILGPSDSGVYIRAIEQRKKLEKAAIPVISSLVAAKVLHQKGGWFFLTNINVERRAQVMHEYLNKYWIRSIAVLYEDNEFGRRAEEEFSGQLEEKNEENYYRLPYTSLTEARELIKYILKIRAEAVGIFSNRRDLADLLRLLKTLNASYTPYRPLTFSIIDTRGLKGSLGDDDTLYFVSVTDDTQDTGFDDVRSLAYDTTKLILGELHALAVPATFNYQNDSWRETFRTRFEGILSGKITPKRINGNPPGKTRLRFRNYENITRPQIFKLGKNVISKVNLRDTVTFAEKLGQKLDLTLNRFGYRAILNFSLIFIIVLWLSIKDIKRWWYVGKLWQLFLSPHFWLLLFSNAVIALAAYIYLGETGNIRYDSTLTALLLSLTPSTILRLTLFETSTGKALGLAKYYENFLQWIHERLTIRSFKKQQPYINVIAYHNSVYGMRCLLNEIAQNATNKEQRIRMQAGVDEELKNAELWITRRKTLARLLFQKMAWDELAERDFVPERLKKYKPGSGQLLLDDPEKAVRRIARHCSHYPLKRILIQEKINSALKQLTPERKQELLDDHKKDIDKMKTPNAIMIRKVTFLFMLTEYDPDFCDSICCEGESIKFLDNAYEYCTADEKRKTVIEKKIKELKRKFLENKSGEQKDEYKKTFDQELGNLPHDPIALRKAVGFIFVFNDCDPNYLVANDLLPHSPLPGAKLL